MSTVIGIDLGTTNSCVAVYANGQNQIVATREGSRTLPSIVATTTAGDRLVGVLAKRQAITNPENSISGIKRLIGRKAKHDDVERLARLLPYEVTCASNGDAWVRMGGREHSPQEISACILRELRSIAADFLGEEPTHAVITVPAYFNDRQRQATKDAATIAGLEVMRILNEPTAAALAFGHDKLHADRTIAVIDLGGGTFDVTLLNLENGTFEVLATSGDTYLGGDDFDERLMQYLISEFQAKSGLDLTEDPAAIQRLREAAEGAKRELSDLPRTSISLPFLAVGPDGPAHFTDDNISRELFDELTADLIDRLVAPCLSALGDAELDIEDLDEVLLVGGMTRVPAVRAKIEEIFQRRPTSGVNADEAVALGAAVQTAIFSGQIEECVLLDVTPHSMGIRTVGNRMSFLVDRNTRVPTAESKVFATTRDEQTYVDIEVYQGESNIATENAYLGRFTLGNLPTRRAGNVRVDVRFEFDADGLLHVTAEDVQSGNYRAVTMSPSGGLTPAQVDRISGEFDAAAAG